jgi:hypothetical protein
MAATKEGLGGKWPSDGFVPSDSALGHHEEPDLNLSLPESRRWVLHGTHHFDLLGQEAYEKIKEWLAS